MKSPKLIIKPVSKDGKITLPKKLREKYKIEDYVVISENEGCLEIRCHKAE